MLGIRGRTGLEGGLMSCFSAKGGVRGGEGGDTTEVTAARPGSARLFALLFAHDGAEFVAVGDGGVGFRRGLTPMGPLFAQVSCNLRILSLRTDDSVDGATVASSVCA